MTLDLWFRFRELPAAGLLPLAFAGFLFFALLLLLKAWAAAGAAVIGAAESVMLTQSVWVATSMVNGASIGIGSGASDDSVVGAKILGRMANGFCPEVSGELGLEGIISEFG